MFAALPGFLNAIVYGFTKDVKQRDKEFIQKYFGNLCNLNLNINNPKQNRIDDDDDSEDDDL